MDIALLICIASILFSAFFSGMEIAFLTSNKLQIELEVKQGKLTSKIISDHFLNDPSKFIVMLLVGNNISLVVYGIYMSILMEPLIRNFTPSPSAILLSQTVISTLIILVTAEFLPKAFFRIAPNNIITFFAIPAFVLHYALYPFVWITLSISKLFLKVLKVEMTTEVLEFGKIDLDNFLREATSVNDDKRKVDKEIQFFQNALAFSELKVRDCLIPRTEIVAVEVEDSLDELKNELNKSGKSKVLVYRDNIDNIIGYVHAYELFKKPESIKAILRPVSIIPETMMAEDALKNLTQAKRSIAIVVDEFGGTSGLLTIEDIIEEIFGDIKDEHDVEILEEKKLNDFEFIFSGRLEIDYLNRKYNFNIEESEDYSTIAGFIIKNYGKIPTLNEEIKIMNYNFKIISVSGKRIETVFLRTSDKE